MDGCDLAGAGCRKPGAVRDYILKLLRKGRRVDLSGWEGTMTLAMAGTEAYPGGGPSRIDTAQVQTPPWGMARGVSGDGTR